MSIICFYQICCDNIPLFSTGFEDKTFDEFLGTRKLTPNVRHYVKYAIAMATDTTNTLEVLQQGIPIFLNIIFIKQTIKQI